MNTTPDKIIYEIRPAHVQEIVSLRHSVLRAGLPPHTAIFDCDDQPTTRHWVAVTKAGVPDVGKVIGCATVMKSTLDGEDAWQLRGMAIAPAFRRTGVGRRMVLEIYRTLRQEGPPLLLWCNAREPAVEFYRALGWTVFSDRFDIPTAGPHYKMKIRLTIP